MQHRTGAKHHTDLHKICVAPYTKSRSPHSSYSARSPPHFNYSLVGKIRLCTSCQVTPQHGHVPLQDAGNDLGHDHLGAVGEAAGSKCGI